MRRIHSTQVNEFHCDDFQKLDDPAGINNHILVILFLVRGNKKKEQDVENNLQENANV